LQRKDWRDYLPDGRAQTAISPNGSEREHTYFGMHRVKEEVEVRTSLTASEVVENNSFYDPQFRLERIARGEGVSTASLWQEASKYDSGGPAAVSHPHRRNRHSRTVLWLGWPGPSQPRKPFRS